MTGFLQCEKQKNFLVCDHSARKIVKKRRFSLQFENFVMLIVNQENFREPRVDWNVTSTQRTLSLTASPFNEKV